MVDSSNLEGHEHGFLRQTTRVGRHANVGSEIVGNVAALGAEDNGHHQRLGIDLIAGYHYARADTGLFASDGGIQIDEIDFAALNGHSSGPRIAIKCRRSNFIAAEHVSLDIGIRGQFLY